jgi:hypothetical protein
MPVSEDIPDVDARNTLDLLHRRDSQREQILSQFLKARVEIQQAGATAVIRCQVAENAFEGIVASSLSPGYRCLLNKLVDNAKQELGTGGFLTLLLSDEIDFVATMKAAIFTVNESWYNDLCSLNGNDEVKFNSACSCIVSVLFQNLYEASTFNRKSLLSSYHHRLYKMMTERSIPPWKVVNDKLPICLRTNNAPVCLLIQCLSDILLEWVYAAMSTQLQSLKGRTDLPKAADKAGDFQEVIINQVQRFFGWSIFSLKQKLENEERDNKDSLELLERMSILHHEAINDEVYMQKCYPLANVLLNKGGLTLVAKSFIGFGRSLMRRVNKFTVETMLREGNRAIENLVSNVLQCEKLKRIFLSSCETSQFGWKINKDKESMTTTVQSLYTALAKKTIHAWAGIIARRFKELHTGRQAKNSTELPLRVELNASTRSAKKKAAKQTKKIIVDPVESKGVPDS